MIRDRGKAKKWQGFMMPEFIKKLKETEMEDKKEKQPVLDEQKMEEINELVAEAMERNLSLTFRVYNKRYGCFELIKGKVHYVDTIHKNFRIIDENEVIQHVHFSVIVDVFNE